MSSAMETPHLNPLPEIGERRIRAQARVAVLPRTFSTRMAREVRLSLSQREKIKVRDCSP
jgi:hypothetical protein